MCSELGLQLATSPAQAAEEQGQPVGTRAEYPFTTAGDSLTAPDQGNGSGAPLLAKTFPSEQWATQLRGIVEEAERHLAEASSCLVDLRVALEETGGLHGNSKSGRRRRKNHDDNLITVAETADRFNCSESTIYNMLQLGLPSVKPPGLGRRIVWDKAAAAVESGAFGRSRVAKKLRARNSGRDAGK